MRACTLTHCARIALIVSLVLTARFGSGQEGGGTNHTGRNRIATESWQPPPSASRYCGIDALYAALVAAGHGDAPLSAIEERARPGPDGVSLLSLTQAAEDVDVRVDAVRASLDDLRAWRRPAVLHVNQRHYIALLDVSADTLHLFDNGIGTLAVDDTEFADRYRWEGAALVIGGVPPRWLVVLQSPLPIVVAPLVLGAVEFLRRVGRKRTADRAAVSSTVRTQFR